MSNLVFVSLDFLSDDFDVIFDELVTHLLLNRQYCFDAEYILANDLVDDLILRFGFRLFTFF